MKGLDTGKNKVQKICDLLRKETLEPAKQEAKEIVENAHMQAEIIVKEAQKKAEDIAAQVDKELEAKKKIFSSSLHLACKQGIELLKQKIEKELFNPELNDLIVKASSEPNVITSFLNAIAKTLGEKAGEGEWLALIPKGIDPRQINQKLTHEVLKKLKGHTVEIGEFLGGAKLQIKDQMITIDISDAAIRELIAQFIRKDLRDFVFYA